MIAIANSLIIIIVIGAVNTTIITIITIANVIFLYDLCQIIFMIAIIYIILNVITIMVINTIVNILVPHETVWKHLFSLSLHSFFSHLLHSSWIQHNNGFSVIKIKINTKCQRPLIKGSNNITKSEKEGWMSYLVIKTTEGLCLHR